MQCYHIWVSLSSWILLVDILYDFWWGVKGSWNFDFLHPKMSQNLASRHQHLFAPEANMTRMGAYLHAFHAGAP
ncbi:hypothetical protein EYC84_002547 [Monilinia fructicola]|uniref:EXS domain-containing protein n=1 Tax=Monilinia fructicola TaxID=38448 RepID=A0A5M9JP97_MONFR|nr:hypothetical protein EYC84_002547 [Monilinia fructicola]